MKRGYERRGFSVLSKLQIAWKTLRAERQAYDLLRPVLSPVHTPTKLRGSTLVTTVCSNITIFAKKPCVYWSTARAQFLFPDVPRQGETSTGICIPALRPWQSRATSMLPETREKENPSILPVAAAAVLCCLLENKPNFAFINSTRIWSITLQKLISVRYGACLCSPKVIAVDHNACGFSFLLIFLDLLNESL